MLFICKLILCFIIFSFLGWCLEVAFARVILKKFVNRGFLIGPLCPLYGIGCVVLYLLLNGYSDSPVMVMLASIIVCSILEYFASYIMEKIFKTRWWDYTNTMKFNLNGRICLELIIPFAILGLLVVYILFPAALSVLSYFSDTTIYILTIIVFVLGLTDLIISSSIILKFTKDKNVELKDMTEEINAYVKNALTKKSKSSKKNKTKQKKNR